MVELLVNRKLFSIENSYHVANVELLVEKVRSSLL